MPCRVDEWNSNCCGDSNNFKKPSNPIDDLIDENASLKKRIIELESLELKELENIAFNSFMTVFLCKAMEIVVSNFDYKFVNSDLEWWFKEHQRRDNNHDESELNPEELAKKLIEFNRKYRVE